MGGANFKEFSVRQRNIYLAAVEIYRTYLSLIGQGYSLKGGMHWKKIRGREYLYRYRDRQGNGESLGPRSELTERLFGDFTRARRELNASLQAQRLRLEEQGRFCRAAKIHRVPQTMAKILRRLEQDDLGHNVLVIGTTALYAYEFAAGVFLTGSVWPELLDEARSLTLLGDGDRFRDDLLRVLRQADRSFAPLQEGGCAAANREGFLVKLIKAGIRRPGRPKTITVSGAAEPLPPDAGNLQSLAASPKLAQVVIGKDGLPTTVMVPDPRAFALHKLWLSQQEDREEGRRARDLRQALAVAELVLGYLPQYDYSASDLAVFPGDLGGEVEEGAC